MNTESPVHTVHKDKRKSLYFASFFFTFPILILHTFMRWRRTELGVVKSAVRTFLFWLPILVAMVLVVVFNGNEDVTKAIWTSWNDCMQRYPTSRVAEMGHGDIGMGVGFLEKDIWYALSLHASIVWKSPFLRVIPIALVNIYVFAAFFYFDAILPPCWFFFLPLLVYLIVILHRGKVEKRNILFITNN